MRCTIFFISVHLLYLIFCLDLTERRISWWLDFVGGGSASSVVQKSVGDCFHLVIMAIFYSVLLNSSDISQGVGNAHRASGGVDLPWGIIRGTDLSRLTT